MLLEEEWLQGRSIIMLEPRRLAARMAARRMAAILDEPVGRKVGYRVRFDSSVSRETRLEVVTEGILTRRLQHDPELGGVGLVIFDEFHERSLHADLALALCLDVMNALRSDLKILVMSATLDIAPIAGMLKDAGIVEAEGREYPVEARYLREPVRRRGHGDAAGNNYSFPDCVNRVSRGVIRAAGEGRGDILAFLPGTGEIFRTAGKLAGWGEQQGIVVCPLHGSLPRRLQDQAVLPDPGGRRRVVLATSIAETSLTIEGVGIVVDSGWSRVQRFDPNSGLSRLTTVRVSQAAAEQRRGRAGRLGPGICFRLWDRSLDPQLPSHDRPEILDADLAWLALELANWGVAGPEDLQWVDPPPSGHFAQAVELLGLLGALDEGGSITAVGKRMAEFPVHPRLARMLTAAADRGEADRGCDLAALLSERDILFAGEAAHQADIETRLEVLIDYRRTRGRRFSGRGADVRSCDLADRAARQFKNLLRNNRSPDNASSSGALLAFAYPDRVARLRESSIYRYLLANGRGACLPEGDHLAGTPYLVAAHLDAGRAEGRIFLAAAIGEREILELFADSVLAVEEVSWDNRLEEVVAERQVRLDSLVLSRQSLENPDPEAVQQAMLEGVRQLDLEALPWTEEARSLQARIMLLRECLPEHEWPECGDRALEADLASWLLPWLSGMRRRSHLASLDMKAILRSRLDWNQQRRLEELAPTHMRVPSGSRKKVRYAAGETPVLAVRLQEMFGLRDTPSVCGGRVKVMLHLLSPAQRPVQITQDLRGFWEKTYPEVKKELRGRYPKHYWPDDPWSAIPTSRVKPVVKK
jgi:ATP-dependent helicase HrpB